MRRTSALLVALVLLFPSLAPATDLKARLKPLIDRHEGTVAVAVKHLATGEDCGYRESEPMPTASLIKVAVMVEAYRQADAGTIDLGELVTLSDEDKVPGSGILTEHFSGGLRISLRDAIRLMIVYSDNTATNLVLDRIGLGSTAEAMERLGLPNTKIHAKVFRGDTSVFPERSKQFGLGSTTAVETVRLLAMIHAKTAASAEACDEMLDHLQACDNRASLPRLLPEGTKVAFKTGAVTRVRTAAGIIESPGGALAVCVLTSENKDRRWSDDNAGMVLCARIARAVYDHFNPSTQDEPDQRQEVATGASGWLVEALQRTLNRRLAPSPRLSIDGEFGPATRAAVIAFQKQSGLTASGVVDRPTWKALGSLVTTDSETAPQSLADLPVEAKAPPDELTGPPFVTCKAWAIGDAATGELLWTHNGNRRLDFASTTKLMTAFVVLRLADRDPSALDEIVTFSEQADRTPGSTSRIRAGERLPVRELLYGLMLPSGNDASIALAEHFGGLFEPPPDNPGTADPVVRFVAEMNRTAAELGMHDTRYANPHGLTAKGHESTCADLLRLASVAARDKNLMRYVGTPDHVGRLEGPGGYAREILWENTNQLLETEGYLGVKTGTTSAAGACLISLGQRSSDRLIIVVLGATSSDARYTDTRNLYRWAWLQRGHK